MSQEYIEERLKAGQHLIPSHMTDAIKLYVLHGIPPGSFLTAVLSNDLFEAVGRADDANQQALVGWVLFLYNYVPSGCKGSPEHYREWIARGGCNF